jgi:hypothetical protein
MGFDGVLFGRNVSTFRLHVPVSIGELVQERREPFTGELQI